MKYVNDMVHTGDNASLYETTAIWSTDYLDDPYYRSKVNLIKGITPEGVRTVLDVGCGNGAILNSYDDRYCRVGSDRSWTALQYVQGYRVRSSSDALPFAQRSFDLVMAHELLEHLSEGVFKQTVQELTRVASRYLMVSVPYRERIEQQFARCGSCRCVYNVWGHVRSFHEIEDIRRLFPGFDLRLYSFCGRANEYMSRLALWVSQRIGGRWAHDRKAICPKCESRLQFVAGYPRRAVAGLTYRLDRLIPKTKEFYWLLCLFERSEARFS